MRSTLTSVYLLVRIGRRVDAMTLILEGTWTLALIDLVRSL